MPPALGYTPSAWASQELPSAEGMPTGFAHGACPPGLAHRAHPQGSPSAKTVARRESDAPEDPAMIFLFEKGFDILDVLHLWTKPGVWRQFKRYVTKSNDHYFAGDTASAQNGWELLADKARAFLAKYPRPPQ